MENDAMFNGIFTTALSSSIKVTQVNRNVKLFVNKQLVFIFLTLVLRKAGITTNSRMHL